MIHLVTFKLAGIRFVGYPYVGASVRGLGFVSWSEVRDADTEATPPALRLRSGEILEVPAPYKTRLERALADASIPVVRRPDVWALLLEPFLDTSFDKHHQRQTLARLAELGFSRSEVAEIRKCVGERVLAYNAIHWDWVHLGLFDLLSAHSNCFGWFGSKELYDWAMEIASRES